MARFKPLSVAFAATFVSSMPALADPVAPATAPSHVEAPRWSHRFYPAEGIYYSSATTRWYWHEDDAWRDAKQLPARYRQYTSKGVTLLLSNGGSHQNFARPAAAA